MDKPPRSPIPDEKPAEKQEYSPLTEREKAVVLGALRGSRATPSDVLMNAMASGSSSRTPKPPSGATLPRVKHDRKVSWDFAATIGPPPDIIEKRVTSNDSADVSGIHPASSVSVTDVARANPMEDEADTLLQKALDDEGHSKGLESAQKSILGNLPDNTKHNFTAPGSPASSIASGRKHRNNKPSTAETLWGLAAEMKNIHGTTGSEHFAPAFGAGDGGNADLFATSATNLLKRVRSQKRREEEEARLAAEEAANPTPADRWKKLRMHVQGVNAFDSKKTDVDLEAGLDDDSPVSTENDAGDDSPKNDSSQGPGHKASKAKTFQKAFLSDFHDFEEWVRLQRMGAWSYVKTIMLFLVIPCTGIAAILFYLVENPPCGTQSECIEQQRLNELQNLANALGNNRTATTGNPFRTNDLSEQASISWMILFFGGRQVATFTMARMTMAFVIDFLCLRTALFVQMIGPMLTLSIVQSRGWVFVMFWWGVYNFAFNYGTNKFARHWLFFQDAVDLFNDVNPSGGFTASEPYLKAICVMVVAGFIISLKRFWVGLVLGKQTFSRYADDLAKIIKKCLFIGQVANLARDIQKYDFNIDDYNLQRSEAYNKVVAQGTEDESSNKSPVPGPGSLRSIKSGAVFDGADLSGSVRVRLNELLGAWEEPKTVDHQNEDISISSIIQFRQSLSYLNTSLPFGVAFGVADSRELMIQGAESVYKRLLGSKGDSELLSFDTIALLAVKSDGNLDEEKLKELIRVFRPDRDGRLSLIDFAKSIDAVYKDLRTLRASVANASRMDKAFERIINVVFYFLLVCTILASLGIDPLVLFASISGLVLGFSFMIGSACSKIFEGLLLILLRRPYDIGDRINVSNVGVDTPGTGSPGWIVKDVDLFTTTVVYASSNETATYSNGSLAAMRIINAARSPQAYLWFLLKFPIDTPYNKLKTFRSTLEKFVKARPREWLSLVAFRVTRVEADLGFVEYIVFAQHREAWQNTGACLQSKADLSSFALEISKKMNMRYKSPPMPVDLTMRNPPSYNPFEQGSVPLAMPDTLDRDRSLATNADDDSVDFSAVAAMFETGTPK